MTSFFQEIGDAFTADPLKSLAFTLSLLAFLISITQYILNRRRATYTNLDTYYNGLLKEALSNPTLRNKGCASNYDMDDKSFQPDFKAKYEIYAFMCINFCETMYDCHDNQIWKTWSCIFYLEMDLHQAWYQKNPEKFKKEFHEFVQEKMRERS
jgi:hypothetical protein